ncbi:MAG TPA: hypothetical protein VFP58_02970 [Candidatus Eisenbacteria bacterium]|nr:hypothetical protein [Candidatus Eisenbacteria bacterium]
MRMESRSFAVFLTVVSFCLAGCGERRGPAGLAAPSQTSAPMVPEIVTTAAARIDLDFDPGTFVDGVDHPYFPLEPGATYTYVGTTSDGVETIVVEVLHQRKTILGVEATVVRDRVYLDGELVEDTFDWYAQDQDGNVWYLGEDSKEYEDGQVVSTAGSWEAGVNGAEAGIIMLAALEKGDTYAQEHAPGVAEDQARIVSLDESVTVPHASYTGVLQTLEWTPLEPGNRGYKYYAEGIGLVLETSKRNGGERVELVSVTGL